MRQGQGKMLGIIQKVKSLMPYLIAIICILSFFSSSFFPSKSEKFLTAKKTHIQAKAKRTIALENVKKIAIGTKEYELYLKEKLAADLAWEELNRIAEEDKVFNFTSIHQFFYSFGWAFGVFLYAIFNLFRVYTSNPNDIGYKVLHTTILSISIFYMCWIFQPLRDLSVVSYYFASAVTATLISYSVYLMSKYNFSDIGKLQLLLKDVFDFILFEVKEKELIKENKKEIFRKRSITLMKNALDNE